ncbi:hypothetical protein TURU_008434 [Turdus rufiventris]|nr:hypothetical protein TURU_008434 [Turdus rufiventris]
MAATLDPGDSDLKMSLVAELHCWCRQSASTSPFASGGKHIIASKNTVNECGNHGRINPPVRNRFNDCLHIFRVYQRASVLLKTLSSSPSLPDHVLHALRPGGPWCSEMKMETVGKAELGDSEVPPKSSEKQETASDEHGPIELETQTQKDNMHTAADSAVLSSMPCLLMELRRDSSESQLASTESDRPMGGRVYESDSSNHCMLSPSSSGHLADSDTLSSPEENEPCQAEAAVKGDLSAVSGAAVGRKSRRSRSESETSTMAAKKNRQSSDKQNGRATKVKGHRSQKHKERIRLLRQKREAAARKKYNLLQDSSTSDSDLTCDSSTSSSDDDEEVSGSSKTITAEIPAGFSRAGGSGGATREIPGLLYRGTMWDRNCIGTVLEEAMNCFAEMQRQTGEISHVDRKANPS